MIADHPWLGCGPGNFQEVYTQYKLPEGQRGDRRSAQFPVGDLGNCRHARRVGVSGRVGVFCVERD